MRLQTTEGVATWIPWKCKVTASVEEIAHYNMLLTEALYELPADKGIVSKEEIVERVRQLKAETTVNFRRV